MSVRSNWPVLAELMRKYVESSIGQRTPFGMKQKEPSEKTAELSVAKKLSEYGTTVPRYLRTSSGWFWTASEKEQKMTPTFSSSARNVVATDTESKTASTATPASFARSRSGMPSFS